MWLHIDMLGLKELFGAFASQILNYVSKLAAAVIAFPGIPFCVLVCENASRRFQYGLADEIFRSNQLKSFMLTALLVLDRSKHVGIDLR